MRRSPCWIAFGIAALSFSNPARAADPPPFEWKDGDRVVLIGDTLIERDQKYGYLETLITAANPDKAITFRNLGWSGDTVRGLSRARFGPPAEGFQHLKDHVVALRPTVLVVSYGMAESFAGEAGLPAFVSGLNELLDAVTASRPRLIFLSPIAHEDLGRPLPDPASHNRSLERYRDAIRTIAGERSAWFVDLYKATSSAYERKLGPLTDNGIHPNAFGDWYLAVDVLKTLLGGSPNESWDVRIGAGNPNPVGGIARSRVSALELTKVHARFQLKDAALPVSQPPAGSHAPIARLVATRTLFVNGLDAGNYKLSIDGNAVTSAGASAWAGGVPVVIGPEYAQLDALRAAINAKNELYFYRWRPQNETYLFGFRKHEQGNNAREIPLFDPLVEAREKEIARLRNPVTHVYELTRDTEVTK